MAVFRVPKQDTDNFYIVQTKWQSGGLSLIAINDDLAWTGQLTNSEVKDFGNCVGKSEHEYLTELKCALSGDHKNNFCYLIEDDKLIVKKLDHKTHMKVRFGTIKLEKVPVVSMYAQLFDSILQEVGINKMKIKELEKEVDTMKAEQTNLKQMFSSCVAEKASLEATLYAQFLKILNAKKEKNRDPDFEDNPPLRKTEEHLKSRSNNKRKAVFNNEGKSKRSPTPDVFEPFENTPSDSVNPATTIGPSTSREGKEQPSSSNHYDSETDVDTDEDTATKSNNPEPEETCTRLKLSTDSPDSPPPRRILPKRNRGCKRTVKLTEELSEVNGAIEEFNSQSLLDDF